MGNPHIEGYVTQVRDALRARRTQEIEVRATSGENRRISHELTATGWGRQRWGIFVGEGDTWGATDGRLEADDCVDVVAELTGWSPEAVVLRIDKAGAGRKAARFTAREELRPERYPGEVHASVREAVQPMGPTLATVRAVFARHCNGYGRQPTAEALAEGLTRERRGEARTPEEEAAIAAWMEEADA